MMRSFTLVLPREGEVARAKHATEGRVQALAKAGAAPSVSLAADSSPYRGSTKVFCSTGSL
jgi:hypothetical protein